MLTLNDGRSELWQWDTGRKLTVDADCSQVHFSNKVFGRSIDVDVVDGTAIIPDVLLQTDKDLNVWAFVGTAENGYTKISKTFKVNRRNKPADYVFTPAEQMTLNIIQRQIGELSDLKTEAKENLVAAINEAARTGGGGGSSTVELDTTLTQPGQAADAAVVGNRLSALSEENAKQDAAIKVLENASGITPKMSNIIKAGTIFKKPEGLPYCGWPWNNIQYDPDTNSIVFLINAAVKHGDNGNTHLYMGVMSLDTYDVTIKEIGNPTTLGHGFYTMGFCINSAGEYLYVDAQSSTLGKSLDKGVTWTETSISQYSNWPESLTQLSNGRYLMWSDGSVNNGVLYSDDDCASWTPVAMTGKKAEGHFLELPGGVVMCFMRKSTNGTDNGAWNGTKIKEPIVISISRDYGNTWSTATDSTTLLEGCANIASAFYHADEDLIEVFTSPRYPYGDTYGAVFQYIATREDALNDRFGEPKVVLYSKAHSYQDFGHIGGCFDASGDMHLMYYDGDGGASGAVNYHYMKASRNQAVLPVTKDDASSQFLPYSSSMVLSKLAALRLELITMIEENPGGTGGGGDNLYVKDGLAAHWDFLDANARDATNYAVIDKINSVPMFLNENVSNEWTFTTPTGEMSSYFGDYGVTCRTSTKTMSAGKDLPDVLTSPNLGSLEMMLHGSETQAPESYIVWCSTKSPATKTNTSADVFVMYDNDTALYYNTTSGEQTKKMVHGNAAVADNTYTHVVFTVDTSTVSVYVNGALSYSADMTTTVEDFSSFTNMFTNVALMRPNVLNCRLYDRVLSAAEVKKNYDYEKTLRGF